MIVNKIIAEIKAAKSIAILPHVFVDGDGLGSSIALALALEKLNKQATVFLEEEIPDVYEFIQGKHLVKVYEGQQKSFDFVIALDTGDFARLGERGEFFSKAAKTANIDHHKTNSEYAMYNYVQATSSSVGEIVYQLIHEMGISLDNKISECLYLAIVTDTGGFRYSNTTTVTHQISGDLIRYGVDVAKISKLIFDTVKYEKVKLMGEVIQSLELFENGKIACLTVRSSMLEHSGAKEEDCDGLVNLARNVIGVEVAILLREKENEVKINLRSNTYVDVSAIARVYEGGGHERAAGCRIKGNCREAEKLILDEIRKVL